MEKIIRKALDLLRTNKGVEMLLTDIESFASIDSYEYNITLILLKEYDHIHITITDADLRDECYYDKNIVNENPAMTMEDFKELPLPAKQQLRIAYVLWSVYQAIKHPECKPAGVLTGRSFSVTTSMGIEDPSIITGSKTISSKVLTADDYGTISWSSPLESYITIDESPFATASYCSTSASLEETIKRIVEEKVMERVRYLESEIEFLRHTKADRE